MRSVDYKKGIGNEKLGILLNLEMSLLRAVLDLVM